MPALSPTMEEGKLVKWLVEEGATVRPGDVIAEIETDKATMEIEAVDEGRIQKLLVAAGNEPIKVNTPIATLSLVDDEQLETQAGPTHGATTAPAEAGMIKSTQEPESSNGRREPRASPVARRLAREHGLDLEILTGSGPKGRIIKRDIEAALEGSKFDPISSEETLKASQHAPHTKREPEPPIHVLTPVANDDTVSASEPSEQNFQTLYEEGTYELVPHDGMRKTLAERLTYSKQTIPHYYLSIDCRLDELLNARDRINNKTTRAGTSDVHLSVNDFIIKAMGLALQYVPSANVTWSEKGALYHKTSDVAVAVAVEGGIYTPLIRHAEFKSLSEISSEMKELATRAHDRRLAPHEYMGGTTTISNLGMYGVKQFEAVINPPHATILAVGAADRRPIVVGETIEIATLTSFTLSCDHRVVDGAVGADLLAAFKSLIEDPIRMLV